MRTVRPVLCRSRGKDGMFDREDEGASCFHTVIHLATDEVEPLHIMQGHRTEQQVEGFVGKVDVVNRQPMILDGRIVGALSGAGQHVLREINSPHASCKLRACIAAVPAKATAQIQHVLLTKIGQQLMEGRPLARRLQPADGTGHLTVLSEKCRIIIFVLPHGSTTSSSSSYPL